MIWDVLVGVGKEDVPEPAGASQRLRMHIDDGRLPQINHGIWDLLSRHQIASTPDAAVDLLRFAVAAYCADMRAPRSSAPDRWSRHFRLHLPVLLVERWEAAKDIVESLLRFLTGDFWEVRFYAATESRPPSPKLRKTHPRLDASAVCLFSGGLDSFIGASDELAKGRSIYLVSHSGVGGKYATPAQKELAAAMIKEYGPDRVQRIAAKISPPSVASLRVAAPSANSETSMRSRSLIFLSLGVTVAASLSKPAPLIVPENGFISVNPPLTHARVGSHSTRTTHPNTIRLFHRLLRALDFPSTVACELPYRFRTKGEMILQAEDSRWVRAHVLRTVSCGKPNRTAIQAFKRGLSQVTHCGCCVPCIIRRAAFRAAAINGEQYLEPVLDQAVLRREKGGGAKTAADHKAFRTAMERGFGLPDLSASGPVPPEDVRDYLDVVRRGLVEVSKVI